MYVMIVYKQHKEKNMEVAMIQTCVLETGSEIDPMLEEILLK